ncbi:MAG: GGDEF domain-containing protein [Burkholderiales bacterium]|nr:GGDEF domain-containing protein [Burkholderiales bacterium]MCL4687611.1 GGDEF domain-containing protein [Burkholderiales bacterium]
MTGLSVPTLLAATAVASFVMAVALAIVAYRRMAALFTWAGAIAAHGVAYVLFVLRGAIPDLLSIVAGNVALSAAFALFATGLAQFQGRHFPMAAVWGPVAAVAVVFTAFLGNAPMRVIAGGAIFAAQALLVLVALVQHRTTTPGRGQYVLMAGFALVSAVFAGRILAALGGGFGGESVLSGGPVQQASFMVAILIPMVLALGLVLMAEERAGAKLQEANRKLADLSVTDALTGLANRRHFDRLLASEWSRAARRGSPFTVLMVDVDHFKRFNDRYGHLAGDDCLVRIAGVLKTFTRRSGDVAARYGGEEFAIVYSDMPAEVAARMAENVRQGVEALAIPHEDSPFGRVTLSVGVATMAASRDIAAEAVLKRADEALYEAKASGRNVVRAANAA